jgi:chorismate lyase / 3-hydroxybenzoate synthase
MHRALIHVPDAGLPRLSPDPPGWLTELIGPAQAGVMAAPASVPSLTAATGRHFTHVCARIDDVDALAPVALADAVRDAYLGIARLLGQQGRHPVRFWNFVPGIHTPAGDGTDRYMIFNAGRFAACEHWHGSAHAFDHTLAAASGVGIEDDALTIHCLAADAPGQPVENPRQVPAYRYSRRYGPRPPCFARATRVASPPDGHGRLLVAGTASIQGEQTRFPGDIEAQTLETFRNLDALIAAADAAPPAERGQNAGATQPAFTSMRAYVVRPGDARLVRSLLSARYPEVDDVEYLQAALCRSDLLVEIEGVAQLQGEVPRSPVTVPASRPA